jgi:hypothetical protein
MNVAGAEATGRGIVVAAALEVAGMMARGEQR